MNNKNTFQYLYIHIFVMTEILYKWFLIIMFFYFTKLNMKAFVLAIIYICPYRLSQNS